MANQQTREKNWATYILFGLAVIAGILAFIDAGRYMGWLSFTTTIPGFGELSFVLPDARWFAALMAALLGLIWFIVAYWLWTLNPSGLMFMRIIAVVNLIFLGLSLLGRTSFSDIIWPVLVNILILILSFLDSTKKAFTPTKADVRAATSAARDDAQVHAAEVKANNAANAPEVKAGAAAAASATAAATASGDVPSELRDLTVVEGIGPKIAEVLQAAGINSLAELALKSPEEISQILKDAGLSADPTTWPIQAEMAAAGDMDALKTYQESLQGGRQTS